MGWIGHSFYLEDDKEFPDINEIKQELENITLLKIQMDIKDDRPMRYYLLSTEFSSEIIEIICIPKCISIDTSYTRYPYLWCVVVLCFLDIVISLGGGSIYDIVEQTEYKINNESYQGLLSGLFKHSNQPWARLPYKDAKEMEGFIP